MSAELSSERFCGDQKIAFAQLKATRLGACAETHLIRIDKLGRLKATSPASVFYFFNENPL
jgi:hypothetical protein